MSSSITPWRSYTCALLILTGPAHAQPPGPVVATPLPAGYHFSPGTAGDPNRVVFDFDQDGTADVFAVVETAEGENTRLIAWLSSRRQVPRFRWHPATDALTCCSSVTRKGNVVTVSSRGMRYFEAYKFRYSAQLGDFEVIGFDTEAFGNATNNGSGTTSYNALTGQYQTALHTYHQKTNRLTADPIVRRQRPAPRRYTLTTFDQALSFLQRLGEEE